ncbi:uncharacterized protein LOC105696739 [Orussus abietinus]|uniref:uncharacterized protein LOC105696739 n=1 Tax=Orussus abietinus TaxID=222816 RepID=UPI000625C714|nr:uncharacterized protein LOC105696739 [Orussus abietinus]
MKHAADNFNWKWKIFTQKNGKSSRANWEEVELWRKRRHFENLNYARKDVTRPQTWKLVTDAKDSNISQRFLKMAELDGRVILIVQFYLYKISHWSLPGQPNPLQGGHSAVITESDAETLVTGCDCLV